jgi:hypothetical protein
MRSLLMQLGNDLIGHESDHTSSRVGEVIDTVVIGAGHCATGPSMSFWNGDKLESDGAQSDGTLFFSNFPIGRCSCPTTPIKGPIQMDMRRRTSLFKLRAVFTEWRHRI